MQGSGRATRGLGDWAAVLVLEDDLVNYLNRAENINCMREEMQAELRFGAENSFDTTLTVMRENLDAFRAQGSAWKGAEQEMDPVKRAALFIRMNDLLAVLEPSRPSG